MVFLWVAPVIVLLKTAWIVSAQIKQGHDISQLKHLNPNGKNSNEIL